MTTVTLGGPSNASTIHLIQPASLSSDDPMADLTDIRQDIRDLRAAVGSIGERMAAVETQLTHVATKAWIVGGVAAGAGTVLVAVLSIGWWLVQQYLSPLLQATGHK